MPDLGAARWDHLADALGRIAGVTATRHAPMGPLSTYRVGGPAAVLVVVADADALAAAVPVLRAGAHEAGGLDLLVVGRGSNLLVADAGFAGVVLQLGEGFAGVEIDAATSTVTAGAGASLPVGARRTAAAGLTGFEWAVGVPGSIGGAVRMNAGGHGADLAASLVGIRVVDLDTGQTARVDAADLGLGYRRSSLPATSVVIEVELQLAPGEVARSEATVSEIVAWRRANQPGGANAGSVFTNPDGDSAGRLIDIAGAKGLRIGTAEVSDKHANFIQATPGGSADDVVRVMEAVVARVEEHSGVRLHAETRLAGYPTEVLEALGAVPAGGTIRP